MKIKIILIASALFCMVISCHKKQETPPLHEPRSKYLQIIDRGEGIEIDTFEYKFHKNIISNKHYYTYTNNNDTICYEIDFINQEGLFYNLNDTCILEFKSKQEYILYPSEYHTDVYLFNILFPGVDDDFIYYFSPSMGLIMRRSTTWYVIMHMYSDCNSSISYDNINLLISLVYMNMYYNKETNIERPTPPGYK